MTKTKNLYKVKGGFHKKIAESEFYRLRDNLSHSGDNPIIPVFRPLPAGMIKFERKANGHTWSFIKVTKNGHKMWDNWSNQVKSIVKIKPELLNDI